MEAWLVSINVNFSASFQIFGAKKETSFKKVIKISFNLSWLQWAAWFVCLMWANLKTIKQLNMFVTWITCMALCAYHRLYFTTNSGLFSTEKLKYLLLSLSCVKINWIKLFFWIKQAINMSLWALWVDNISSTAENIHEPQESSNITQLAASS